MHESVLAYRRFRYLKLALVLMMAAMLAYALHRPVEPPNGGTWLGYTLGGLGAVLILWLTGLGVRKRRYASRLGHVRGWLSAHVYLGGALLVIASLHCGFQFGWNIHTLTYALMLAVILTGVYGIYSYARYPDLITRNRGGLIRDDAALLPDRQGGGQTRDDMLEELAEAEQEILALAGRLDERAHQIVLHAIERTAIGGGAWRQLTADRPRLRRPPWQRRSPALSAEEWVADVLSRTTDPDQVQPWRRLLELLGRRQAVLKRLQRDIRYQARLEIWLYLHVPLTFALLAALLAHVVSVFFYW